MELSFFFNSQCTVNQSIYMFFHFTICDLIPGDLNQHTIISYSRAIKFANISEHKVLGNV